MQVIRKGMQGEKRIEVRSFRRMRKETNWDLAGKARSKCVTDIGHKVQLPLGPSTRLCLETIRYKRGHNVLPPLGPSTGRLSEKLGVDGMAHSTLGSPFGRAVSEAD